MLPLSNEEYNEVAEAAYNRWISELEAQNISVERRRWDKLRDMEKAAFKAAIMEAIWHANN